MDPLPAAPESGLEQIPGTGLMDDQGAAPYTTETMDSPVLETGLYQYIEALISENLTYPPLARKRNIEGTVQLSLSIRDDGVLTEISMTASSGSHILDKAAVALLERVFPLDLSRMLDQPLTVTIRIAYSLSSQAVSGHVESGQ
jgi:TonB family protein